MVDSNDEVTDRYSVGMPDRRRHRGAHPDDAHLFSEEALPTLRSAVADLCWLLSRGYSSRAALALVGNRHNLTVRQRQAVLRCACSDEQRAERLARSARSLPGVPVWIDGFNVLTTVEAALAGGVLLLGRDGALRDMASMHGNYRSVDETRPAVLAIAEVLAATNTNRCRWLLDAPVSNSGRLAGTLVEFAAELQLHWEIEVVPDPDRLLEVASSDVLVASADSRVMDGAQRVWQLARETVEHIEPAPKIVDLSAYDCAGSESSTE